MPKATRLKASPEAQHAKFVEAAKRLGTDDDPNRFKETVKKLAKVKPNIPPGSQDAKRDE